MAYIQLYGKDNNIRNGICGIRFRPRGITTADKGRSLRRSLHTQASGVHKPYNLSKPGSIYMLTSQKQTQLYRQSGIGYIDHYLSQAMEPVGYVPLIPGNGTGTTPPPNWRVGSKNSGGGGRKNSGNFYHSHKRYVLSTAYRDYYNGINITCGEILCHVIYDFIKNSGNFSDSCKRYVSSVTNQS